MQIKDLVVHLYRPGASRVPDKRDSQGSMENRYSTRTEPCHVAISSHIARDCNTALRAHKAMWDLTLNPNHHKFPLVPSIILYFWYLSHIFNLFILPAPVSVCVWGMGYKRLTVRGQLTRVSSHLPHCVGLGIKSRLLGLTASALTHEAILLALICYHLLHVYVWVWVLVCCTACVKVKGQVWRISAGLSTCFWRRVSLGAIV